MKRGGNRDQSCWSLVTCSCLLISFFNRLEISCDLDAIPRLPHPIKWGNLMKACVTGVRICPSFSLLSLH
jgi:hypothetical protein